MVSAESSSSTCSSSSGPFGDHLPRHAAQQPEVGQHLPAGQPVRQCHAVGQHADQCLRRHRIGPDVPAEDPHRAAIGAQQPHRHRQRRGLARPVRPDQAEERTGRNHQVDVIDRYVVAELLDQPGELQRRAVITHRVIRGPARGRPRRAPGQCGAGPDGAADGAQAGRIAVPARAVHARAGGRVLPSDTGAWSSPGDSGSCGLAPHGTAGHRHPLGSARRETVTARPVTSRRDLRPRASALARTTSGSRASRGRTSRPGCSHQAFGLSTRIASLSSPRPTAISGPGNEGPDRGGDWFFEGRYEPAPQVASPGGADASGIFRSRTLARQCRRAGPGID